MGYGGGWAEDGKALWRSGDGGVDGVINEDALGLDVVYVQAKRYAAGNSVPVAFKDIERRKAYLLQPLRFLQVPSNSHRRFQNELF